MRLIFSLLFSAVCALSALAQKPYLPYKTLSRDENLAFPVFSAEDNPKAAQNINYLLQLSELNVLDDFCKDDVFEHHSPKGEAPSYDINFQVKENSPRLLSVHFNISSCGATCYYWTSCYNFNPKTGQPIQMGDLLTPEGLERFNEKLGARWAAQIDAGIKDDPAEDIEVVQQFKDCFDEGYTQLESFYVQGGDLIIDAENCLPKFAKFYDIDVEVRFTVKEITTYLNDYGRAVFGISNHDVGRFTSEYLLRELQVYTNKETGAVLGMVMTHTGINCYYVNKKEGVYHAGNLSSAADGFFDDTIAVEIKGNEALLYYIQDREPRKPAMILTRNSY